MRLKCQWWWYTVRRNGYHERTYMKRSDALGFADVSQKIRGGMWLVYRVTKRKRRTIAAFEGIRRE